MTKPTPLVLGDAGPQVQPAKRLSRSAFANNPSAEPKTPVPKPSQVIGAARVWDGLWIGLFGGAALVSIVAAILVIVYAGASTFSVQLPFGLKYPDDDIRDDLALGALFFFLEVSAIIPALHFANKITTRYLVRRQLFFIQDSLAGAINDIDGHIWRFAVSLDQSVQEGGRYGADPMSLNADLATTRQSFIEEIYCDVDLTQTAERMMQRILRTLDIFCHESYDLGRRAADLNKATSSVGLEECLVEMFDRTQTIELRALEKMIDEVRRKV